MERPQYPVAYHEYAHHLDWPSSAPTSAHYAAPVVASSLPSSSIFLGDHHRHPSHQPPHPHAQHHQPPPPPQHHPHHPPAQPQPAHPGHGHVLPQPAPAYSSSFPGYMDYKVTRPDDIDLLAYRRQSAATEPPVSTAYPTSASTAYTTPPAYHPHPATLSEADYGPATSEGSYETATALSSRTLPRPTGLLVVPPTGLMPVVNNAVSPVSAVSNVSVNSVGMSSVASMNSMNSVNSMNSMNSLGSSQTAASPPHPAAASMGMMGVGMIPSGASPAAMMGQFSSRSPSNAQKKHRCKMCDKRFTRPSSLQTHMYSHTGEKPYACDFEGCGRHFSVVSNLRRHKKVHKPEKGSTSPVGGD